MMMLSPDIYRLAGAGDRTTRLVASNLIADHRVSRHCGETFLKLYQKEFLSNPGSACSKALLDYRELVARDPFGTFLDTGNERNFVKNPPDKLAHVWNITSFFQWSVKISDLLAHPVRGLPTKISPSIPVLNQLLRDFLESRSDAMEDLIKFRNWILRRGRIWHPMWAADCDDLDLIRRPGNPVSWFFPLGLNLPPGNSAILVLLTYERPSGLQLVRPTQLEATNNPHHLPSPPCPECEECGLALRLDTPLALPSDPVSMKMVREYIHLQIEFDPGWVTESMLAGAPLTVESDDFIDMREEQFKRYQAQFSGKLGRWLDLLPRKKDVA